MGRVAVITDIHANLPALGSPLGWTATYSPSATHQPWIAEYGGVLLVNCGSVGKPKDGGPLGGFAVLEADGAAVSARIERFDYDARLRRLRRDRHRRPL
ncbi:MAG: metallophosphoesterase family protein [Thermoleophilaceae bacterium]